MPKWPGSTVGNFRDEPIARPEHTLLFEKDKAVLMKQISQLPKACSMRKINEMVKRLRRAVVHVCLMGHLKSKMPMLWGKEAAQTKLIEQLEAIFVEVRRKYQLAEGDFPKLDEYRAALVLSDFSTFASIDRNVLNTLQDLLLKDVPKVTALVAGVGENQKRNGKNKKNTKESDEGDEDVDADSDRLPQMFQMSEKDHNVQGHNVLLAVVISVVVLFIALFVASVMDDHKLLLEFSEKLKHTIQNLTKKPEPIVYE